jgi:3-phosphoshikimate 1-carboxyvinyltransferase
VSSLPDLLAVRPFTRPARGSAAIPGSKSLTNRAMLIAALCDGPVALTGALFSEDTRIMAEALRQMGFAVEETEATRTINVVGRGGSFPAQAAKLSVGLAGTAARFLTALCATARRGTFRLDGVPRMRERPMKGLIDALRSLGADVRCLGMEGFLPIEINAGGLRGGSVSVDARESSQMLSALLMVAPLADRATVVTPQSGVRMPFVRMTLRQMSQFGIKEPCVSDVDGSISVERGSYRSPGTYAIEPDATAASYFAALPLAVGGSLILTGLRTSGESLQGDIRFLEALSKCGGKVSAGNGGISVEFPAGARRGGATEDFSGFSDTFPTLAALAPLLDGPTRITGIAHTRKQETDRVSAMAIELRRLGQKVIETDDSLEIHPAPLRVGQTIDTHGDHRFAMSFGILGSHDLSGNGNPWLTIADPGCCAKTFPEFFDVLEDVRVGSSRA